ncbi:DUF2537 domain-containing protein [Hoyosella rhizosphaerae]|uniref:DUF2537 domain-containing protein n=1 Tax=Hoyosella rhizosphaerae TaxID=1755582 RepID=A0A916UH07_9ACTN|nr:DUF2537 domain-containing protein [Hoyosella rhizosphaerae]MBN4928188.1 DUF2537 domain-containing protein [Hoyosella rhizosphaerae]GGC73080.1 hypothetical protein GCM10011410_27730 [Hoyosella rhizosphaerae]
MMDEDTPWGIGLTFAAFVAVGVAVVVGTLSWGVLSIHPVLFVALSVLISAGAAQPLWKRRTVPTLRWAILGGAAGALIGWAGALAVFLT